MACKSSRTPKTELQIIGETGRLPQSKTAILIDLLSRKSGGPSDALCVKLCCQPHTLRAAISGLRKGGFKVETTSQTSKGGARYRILTKPGLEEAG